MKIRRAKRSAIWKIPTDDLSKTVEGSKTIGEILKRYGLDHKGSNHKTLYARLEQDGISTSHIPRGLGSNKGRKPWNNGGLHFSLDQILVNGFSGSRSSAKRRLLKSGLIKNLCAVCGMPPLWNDKPLTLRLDHINGRSMDYRINNLRMVCPNCDSQLDTYCGKNNKTPLGGSFSGKDDRL